MSWIEHPDEDLDPRAFQRVGTSMPVYGKSRPPPPPDYAAAARETAAGNVAQAQAAARANRVDQVTPWGGMRWHELGGDRWRSEEWLSPVAQQTLDRTMALDRDFADVAGVGFQRARNVLENPQLDLSQLPERAMAPGQLAQDALLTRLGRQWSMEDDALAQRLANQGIGLGSEAYRREMQLLGERRTDAQLEAARHGIGLDMENRQDALREQAFLRDRPLNLISALRAGAQVEPFPTRAFAQQQFVPGADILGATGMGHQDRLQAWSAQQAQRGSMMRGLMGLGLGVAGMPVTGGGSLLGTWMGR